MGDGGLLELDESPCIVSVPPSKLEGADDAKPRPRGRVGVVEGGENAFAPLTTIIIIPRMAKATSPLDVVILF